MKNNIRTILKKAVACAIDFFYPKAVVCACCDKEAMINKIGLCESCAKVLEPYTGQRDLFECLDGFSSGLKYKLSIHRAIYRFKYYNRPDLAEFFVQFMIPEKSWEIDYVVPVPIHFLRKLTRGYNQSFLLARSIALKYGYAVNTKMLKRTKYTVSQTRNGMQQRERNIIGAFSVNKNLARNRCLLLIDDVCTTGSTLNECARVLKEAGALKVFAITACKTDGI
ncbi:MAG: ComF family protein [Clostridia bacterium]